MTGLPPGVAVRLNTVVFDACREEDGTMLEAKGPGYASFINRDDGWYRWFKGQYSLAKQLKAQSEAATIRPVEWHVAEQRTADKIRQMAQAEGLGNIDVIWDP